MDLVVNHSSDEHDCLSSLDLLEIINIVITTTGGRKKENHIIDGAGLTSTDARKYDPTTDSYYLLFFRKQPDLNC
jgi:hypothetical protein